MDISQFGASGAVVAVVILFLKFMRDEATKRDVTYNNVARALERNTRATTKADIYLQQRNGRDAEFQRENIRAIQNIPKTMQRIANAQSKAIITAVTVKEQHVDKQVVGKSITRVKA